MHRIAVIHVSYENSYSFSLLSLFSISLLFIPQVFPFLGLAHTVLFLFFFFNSILCAVVKAYLICNMH